MKKNGSVYYGIETVKSLIPWQPGRLKSIVVSYIYLMQDVIRFFRENSGSFANLTISFIG